MKSQFAVRFGLAALTAGGMVATAPMAMAQTADLAVSPAMAKPGTTVELRATGCANASNISSDAVSGIKQIHKSGTTTAWQGTVKNVSPGKYHVQYSCDNSPVSGVLQVTGSGGQGGGQKGSGGQGGGGQKGSGGVAVKPKGGAQTGGGATAEDNTGVALGAGALAAAAAGISVAAVRRRAQNN